MADNVLITPGVGATVAADDVGGALHQRVKPTWGPDGTGNDVDVASGKPFPVQLRGSDGTDRSNALPVTDNAASLTVDAPVATPVFVRLSDGATAIATLPVSAASLPLPTGAAAAANQPTPYTEDVSGAADPVGLALIGIRRDTLSATEVSADGDNIAIKASKYGSLLITPVDSVGQRPNYNSNTPVALATNQLVAGGSTATAVYTPKFARISSTASGNNVLVAGVSSKKIRVLAYDMITSAAVNVKFVSDATGSNTALSGLKTFNAASIGLVAPFNPVGWFETAAGKPLSLNNSGAGAVVGGELVYIEAT